MEDKLFEMLTKMYSDMQEMKANMVTKQELQEGFHKTNQAITRLENKMDESHKALYDGYKQSIEGIHELRNQVDKLIDQVEHQEIKLQVIKGSK
ncbi:MAG: hypothetical protein K0R93_3154 [Anaerosolibacter sp.]|jgi:ferritin-like metal-binding protein YciE|uniref:hypothetical protein n=1 Tax=Anaerosolibacter sp. TaxID=1872527 RepID=UPI002621FC40|nr:hypothetical protein [Anaerosolibacter sp.]MDF2548256.1 hypothetical protein [Anaerosolibacter sp.]